jgi:hypothetical protein
MIDAPCSLLSNLERGLGERHKKKPHLAAGLLNYPSKGFI